MQKASYLRPKKTGEKKKKTLSRLLSTPGFLSPSLLASTPGGAAEPSCLLAPRPSGSESSLIGLRVLGSPRGERRRERRTLTHLAPVFAPSLLPNPKIKNRGVGRGRRCETQGRGGSETAEEVLRLRGTTTPTAGWEGRGGAGARGWLLQPNPTRKGRGFDFAKVLKGRGFSVSRESCDFFFLFCLNRGTDFCFVLF